MKSIFTIFLDIEKLIYRVLMWFLLVPKAIIKVTVNPAWVPRYVAEELHPPKDKDGKDEKESPFDEYISPVILLLVVALLPALAFSFLPVYGATLTSPAIDTTTTDRFISFNVQTDFRSTADGLAYFHTWTVSQAETTVISTGGSATFQPQAEYHYPGSDINFLDVVDTNTAKDQFLYTFREPGTYFVTVVAGKYDPENYDPQTGAGTPIEVYPASLRVFIPVIVGDSVVVSSESSKASQDAQKKQGFEGFSAQVQKENTIFLALALMLPPLLFAFATKVFQSTIGEGTLKDDFYIQCYYFSPLSLAIWASYYARYFFTVDTFFFLDRNVAEGIIWLPPLIATLWFIRAEVKTISHAREISENNALIITLACLAVLGGAANVVFAFEQFQDIIRLNAIRIFPISAFLLIVAFGIAWYRRRLARNVTVERSNFVWMAVNVVVLFIAFNYVSLLSTSSPTLQTVSKPQVPSSLNGTSGLPTEVDVPGDNEPTPTAQVVSNLPSPTPQLTALPTVGFVLESPTPAPQPFYTEEFNGAVANWIPFMTSGDDRMIEASPSVDKFSVDITPLDDKLARYYLINDQFTYADVQVEVVMANRGVNANGVSLVCRYSDIGWYEFRVSNSGYYSIFVVDTRGIISQGYNEIANGGSSAINTGREINEYTVVCKGNTLSLFVNDELVREIEEVRFNLTEGKIGLGVSSPEKLPVAVDFLSLTVSKPE